METSTNINSLTVRIYALLIKDEKILFLKEKYAGEYLLKLPGGGLELGEGIKETLEREFLEELNLEITVSDHFYTQDFYLASRFKPKEQLLSVYYKVNCDNFSKMKIMDENILESVWIPINDFKSKNIELLPVDKIVIEKFLNS